MADMIAVEARGVGGLEERKGTCNSGVEVAHFGPLVVLVLNTCHGMTVIVMRSFVLSNTRNNMEDTQSEAMIAMQDAEFREALPRLYGFSNEISSKQPCRQK